MAVCWGKMERYNLVFRLSSLKNKFDTKYGNFLFGRYFFYCQFINSADIRSLIKMLTDHYL